MKRIHDSLIASEMKTDLLLITHSLYADLNYTKEDAIQDLLKFLERHNL